MKSSRFAWMYVACGIAATGFCEEKPKVDKKADNQETNVVIKVTASPITHEEVVGPDGADRVILSRDQLGRLNAMDVQTALRQVPGVSISRYQPIGSYGGAEGGSVYIRGLGTARPGSEIRMYTDGIPRESGIWAHPLMDSVPIDFADTLVVNKNPQPQAYPGTFAAIDMETLRKRTPGYEGEANAAYGRYNTFIGSLAHGGKIDDFDYYAGYAYKYSEGARRHGEAELQNAFGRVGWDLSEYDHLGYIYQHTESWVKDPGEKHGITPRYNRFDLMTDSHVLRLDTDRDYIKGYALIYFEDGEIDWYKDHLMDDKPKSPAGQSDTDWHNYGFRSLYDIIIDKLTITPALDIWSEGGRTQNKRFSDGYEVFAYNGRFFTTAPYLGMRYDFELNDTWTFTPSVGSRYYFSSDFDNEWAPCAALTLQSDDLQFFVNASRGVHYPGVYTRGVSAQTWKDLDAETLDTIEAGTKIKLQEKLDLQVAFFHTEADNRMESTTSGLLNTGHMRTSGCETTLHYKPTETLSLFAGGTWTNPETHPVSRLPDWTGTVGASWKVYRYLRWDIDAEYLGSQYAYSVRETNPTLEKLDDDILCNTRIALDLKAFSNLNGELFIAIENFTNRHYSYYPGYPMAGMMWYTGMKVKF